MRGRIITLGILPLICSITAICAIINRSDNYLPTSLIWSSGAWLNFDPAELQELAIWEHFWTSNAAGNAYVFEFVAALLTGVSSFVFGVIHLAMNKEPIRGMNIAIAIQGMLIFTMVNWIFCIIALKKLSWHRKVEQQTTG